MEAMAAQVLVQARNLRGLCAEFAHGARRDAFLALIDDDIESLFSTNLRITLIVLDDSAKGVLATLCDGAAPASDHQAHMALAILDRGQASGSNIRQPGSHVWHLPLSAAAQGFGVSRVNVVLSPQKVLASPVFLGQLQMSTDMVVVCGHIGREDALLMEGLEKLSAT